MIIPLAILPLWLAILQEGPQAFVCIRCLHHFREVELVDSFECFQSFFGCNELGTGGSPYMSPSTQAYTRLRMTQRNGAFLPQHSQGSLQLALHFMSSYRPGDITQACSLSTC